MARNLAIKSHTANDSVILLIMFLNIVRFIGLFLPLSLPLHHSFTPYYIWPVFTSIFHSVQAVVYIATFIPQHTGKKTRLT